MQRNLKVISRALLLSTTLLAATGAAWAQDSDGGPTTGDGPADNSGAAQVPSGQFITPTYATGSAYTPLSPTIAEYNSSVANYPVFHPNGAIQSRLSPDGKTLAVMTSGYNVLATSTGALLGTGAEYIVLYDVSNPGSPVMKQTLRPPNTFSGLQFSPDGSTMYVSGGNDDDVIVYKQSSGTWSQSTTIPLGHNKIGIGNSQYPMAAGLAVSQDGSLLVVANSVNDSISVYSTSNYSKLFEYDLRPFNTEGIDGKAGGETLYGVAIKGDSTIYAASLRDRQIAVVNINNGQPQFVKYIPLPGSPNNILLNKAQDTLFVAQDNSDNVAVINTATNAVTQEIDAIAPPGTIADTNDRYTGAATNNVALSPDNKTLFVSNGGANDVAIVPLTGSGPYTVAGLVPTGWYPTTVTLSADGGTMYVFNGKSDPGANPGHITSSVTHLAQYTYPGGNNAALASAPNQYVFQLEQSGMQVVPVPPSSDYADLTTKVAQNNGWSTSDYPSDDQVMSFLHSHIKHIIYIVKENRTFDQILGDLTNGANADPSLAVFGAKITPNFHNICNNFVTFDNFFDSGEVSGNGWPWSTAARETDWNEKMIPMNYSSGVTRENAPYDAEGQENNVSVGYYGATPADTIADRSAEAGGYDYASVAAALPGGADNLLPGASEVGVPDGPNGAIQGGYIWDAAMKAGLTVRNYGFFSDNGHYGLQPGQPGYVPDIENPYQESARQEWTAAADLIPYTDPYFHGFDNAYPDAWRFEEFQREFNQFAQPGHDMPNLVLLRYMHDHMGNFSATGVAGTEASAETEQADNDYAVGATLDMLAHSRFADDTLVFVTEDDAQDGGDHMDAHRTTGYIIGPYVKTHYVDSTRYTSVSMLRTLEDILGTEHLNLNTAYQRPMADAFNINQGPYWTYTATASTVLESTSLNLGLLTPEGPRSIMFAKGPVVKPLHSAAWWAKETKGFNFRDEDKVPTMLFNEITWKGVLGNSRPYPTTRSGVIMRHYVKVSNDTTTTVSK